MKIVEEKNEKTFTKNNGKVIIKKNNSLLYENCNFQRNEGLIMKKTKYIVSNKEMEELIISKEHFEKYFNKRNIITREEYERYLKMKWYLTIKMKIVIIKKINTFLTL